MHQQMTRIADDFGNELILEAQAVEEIRLREDGILHVLQCGILQEKTLEHFLLDRSNDKEIYLALGLGKRTGKKNELHTIELLQRLNKRTLGLDVLTEDTLELFIEGEFGVDVIVLFAVTVTGLYETNAAEVFELTTNGVDLLTEQTRQLTNEKLLLRM